MSAISATAIPKKSIAMAMGCPWKLPSADRLSVLMENDRVVGYGVYLNIQYTVSTYERASLLAPCTLGETAQRVGVLHPVFFVCFDYLAAFDQPSYSRQRCSVQPVGADRGYVCQRRMVLHEGLSAERAEAMSAFFISLFAS